MRLHRRSLAVLGFLVLTSCRPYGEEDGRWITEEPAGSALALEEREIFRWEFKTEEDVASWSAVNMDLEYRRTGKGLFFISSSTDPYVWRKAAFDAADVDVIRIQHSELHGDAMQVFWAAPGKPFTEQQSLRVVQEDPGGSLIPVYTLNVRRSPEWKGPIGRFRIDSTGIPRRKMELFSVVGTSRVLSDEGLLAALAQPAKVDLGGDARNALRSSPDHPIVRRVQVPRQGATFRFAYGLPSEASHAVDFRVLANTVSDEPAGDEPVELFAASLDPSNTEAWHEAAVDLSPWSGEEVELTLATASSEALDLRFGFPLWGNPEVVPRAPRRTDDRPNVVLIVIDTLRADHMSLYGYSRSTTPTLDEWAARNAIVFENTVAPAPWTLPSHVSMFTGLSALDHGVNYEYPAPRDLVFLAERLQAKGYETAAFTGGAFVQPRYGLAQGFDRFSYQQGSEDASKDLEQGLSQALAWLDRDHPRPFFLFLHTYEVHAPYVKREPWTSRFLGEQAGDAPDLVATRPSAPAAEAGWRYDASFVETRGGTEVPLSEERLVFAEALYDSGIAHTDQLLGQLFRRLEEQDLAGKTLVVLTSDHGEGLGEHGSAGHANLYDFNLLVPLVVALPDRAHTGRRVTRQTRLTDLAPTLLDALGLAPIPDASGRSLLPLIADPLADFPGEAFSYAATSLHGLSLRADDRWKLIYQNSAWQPVHGHEELFDLANDPGELSDLSDSRPAATELLAKLERNYVGQGSFLHVKISNHEAVPLHAVVRGKLAHAFNVKAFEVPEQGMEWVRKETVLTVKPGEDVSFFLEGLAEGELKVVLEMEDEAKRSFVAVKDVLDDLVSGWSVRLVDGSWQESGEIPGSRWTGLAMTWKGRVFTSENDVALPDEELQQKLKDLGYLN